MDKINIDNLLFKFLQTSYLFEKSEEKIFNLSWQEIYLLQILKKKGKRKITDLGELMMLERYQITRLIKHLEEEKKVFRESSKEDARIIYIHISKGGRQSLDDIESYHFTLLKEHSNSITDEELKVIAKSINSFASLTGIDLQQNKKMK